MSDLISKQKVCEVLARFAPENYTQLVEMLVVKLPAVDAVAVVRCKDCKWYERIMYSKDFRCCRIGGMEVTEPNDFCSLGERREENAD